METKKDLHSLNDDILNNLSLEELEDRLELACWGNCETEVCLGTFQCSGGFECNGVRVPPPDA